MTYFRAVYPALSSARRRFTVLFGMGRRGSSALWSSGIRSRAAPERYARTSQLNISEEALVELHLLHLLHSRLHVGAGAPICRLGL